MAAHRLAGRPSVTAEAVTLARAVEHVRPPGERIVDDPYAELFLGPAGRAALLAWKINGPATRLLKRLDPGGMAYVACRHRYLDDQLRAASTTAWPRSCCSVPATTPARTASPRS